MDWTTALKALAPTVATALVGPLGGATVKLIGDALGMSAPTQDKIARVFADGQLTPENVAKLKTLELRYQNDERERQFKYSELAFKDVASARSMQAATKSSTPTYLSYAVLLMGTIMIGSVLYGWAKVDGVLAGTLVGYVVSEMKVVLQYWFGTSLGSREKNDLLAQAPPPPPPPELSK